MGIDLFSVSSAVTRTANEVDNALAPAVGHVAESFHNFLRSDEADSQSGAPVDASVFSTGSVRQNANKVNLPEPPLPPAAPGNGDGQGAHGSTRRDWWDIAGKAFDEGKERILHEGADAFDVMGKDNAARHMRHYLGNTGDTLEMSPDAMMNDMPQFRDRVESHTNNELIDQINQRIADNYTGEPMTFEVTTDWNDFYARPDISQDWYFATGGFSFSQGASVTVTPPESGGPPTVDVTYQNHVFDRYNWDEGKQVEIGGVTITDETVGDLHERGVAQEFDLAGSSEPRSFSYTFEPTAGSGAGPDTPVVNEPADTDSRTGVDDPTRNPDRSRSSGDRDNEPRFR